MSKSSDDNFWDGLIKLMTTFLQDVKKMELQEFKERAQNCGAILRMVCDALNTGMMDVSQDVREAVLDMLYRFHSMDMDENPPHIPLILWQYRENVETFPGVHKNPSNYQIEKTIKGEQVLDLRHAVNAWAMCDMFEAEGIRLKGKRNTKNENGKKADISTHGLVYCRVHVDPNKLTHRQATTNRYGAAVVSFKLDIEGKHLFKLGTKFFPQECSQQVLCTTRKETNWSLISGNKACNLERMPLNTVLWPIGSGDGGYGSRRRWVHPEMVIEEGLIVPYGEFKIHLVVDHLCVEVLGFCVECKLRMYHQSQLVKDKSILLHSLKRKGWKDIGRSQLEIADSQMLFLDLFAMKMVETPKKWETIRALQSRYKIFNLHPSGLVTTVTDEGEDSFVTHVENRMEYLKPFHMETFLKTYSA